MQFSPLCGLSCLHFLSRMELSTIVESQALVTLHIMDGTCSRLRIQIQILMQILTYTYGVHVDCTGTHTMDRYMKTYMYTYIYVYVCVFFCLSLSESPLVVGWGQDGCEWREGR